ncbi:MAG: cardiolipin synthase [Nonlabens sp.]
MIKWVTVNWFLSALIVNYIVALGAAFFLIKNNQNPRKTLSSLLFLVALPFVGLAIYYFFGLEYRKLKIFKRKDLNAHQLIEKWNKRLFISESKLDEYQESFLEERLKMVKLLRHNQEAPLTLKNDVKILYNGHETFDHIFEDLDKAKHHIHLEYFIFNDDNIGNQFIEKLLDARSRDVEVRLIYDSVGSDLSRAAKNKMREAGIILESFMPVIFSNFTRKANYRNHRKIVIIDGHIGFLGGVNVSDDYVNGLGDDKHGYWRDTHLRIEGHAVKGLQAQWMLNWFFVHDHNEQDEDKMISADYFPEIDEENNVPVQIAASGPDTDWANIMEAIFIAINTADECIRITTPYFIPNQAMLVALTSAARAGIDIEIMVPRIGDSWAARYAARSYFEEIIESGIKVFWYCRGMLHAKTMVVDNQFATIGTSNMDYRSFETNFEINALVYDVEVAQNLAAKFEKDKNDCVQIDLEKWKNRSKTYRFKESFCRLWAPLL